jgi:hypothetical protein
MRRFRFSPLYLVGLCLLLMAGPSAQALSVQDYVRQRDSADTAQFHQSSIYITGVAAGYIWANSQLIQSKMRPLFCQEQPIRLNLDFNKIIDDEIGQPYVAPDFPVELLLLTGLARKYPCPE